jgi:LacI family transcriptional regulator
MRTDTYRRVVSAMDQLGYHPNAHARRLRSNHVGALGLTLIDPSHGFLADAFIVEVMAGIGDVLRRHRYDLLIHGIDPARSTSSRDVVVPLGERRVDGMIMIASGPWEQRRPYVEVLVESGYPAVLLQERVQGPRVCCLRTDDAAGALVATEYLKEAGHRRIGFLTGAVSWPAVEARHQGYLRALPAHRWEQPQPRIVAPAWTRPGAAAAVSAYLQGTDRAAWPSALLCANDILAVGALQAAKAWSLQVPDELAIVGFDDMDLCCHTDPQLTTVNVPAYDMGAYAATSLLECLTGNAFPSQDVVFPARFIRRGSA